MKGHVFCGRAAGERTLPKMARQDFFKPCLAILDGIVCVYRMSDRK
jgi:hypothetical protein